MRNPKRAIPKPATTAEQAGVERAGKARAGGISPHAVDVATGRPAAGMRVEIVRIGATGATGAAGPMGATGDTNAGRAGGGADETIADLTLGANGAADHPVVHGAGVAAGLHEVRFHVGAWLAAGGFEGPRFLDVVPFRFHVYDPAQHYHLPFKFTPFGFSLFRGS